MSSPSASRDYALRDSRGFHRPSEPIDISQAPASSQRSAGSIIPTEALLAAKRKAELAEMKTGRATAASSVATDLSKLARNQPAQDPAASTQAYPRFVPPASATPTNTGTIPTGDEWSAIRGKQQQASRESAEALAKLSERDKTHF